MVQMEYSLIQNLKRSKIQNLLSTDMKVWSFIKLKLCFMRKIISSIASCYLQPVCVACVWNMNEFCLDLGPTPRIHCCVLCVSLCLYLIFLIIVKASLGSRHHAHLVNGEGRHYKIKSQIIRWRNRNKNVFKGSWCCHVVAYRSSVLEKIPSSPLWLSALQMYCFCQLLGHWNEHSLYHYRPESLFCVYFY